MNQNPLWSTSLATCVPEFRCKVLRRRKAMTRRFRNCLTMFLMTLYRKRFYFFCVACMVILCLHGLVVSGGYILTINNGDDQVNLSVRRRALLASNVDKTPTKYTNVFSNICDNGSDVFLIFLINTAPRFTIRRKRIRRTWGSIKSYNGYNIRYAFFIGQVESPETQEALFNESRQNEDIIQSGTFKDNYMNMTRKTLSSMDWVQSYCSNARFVVKCDDDAMIHPKNLMEYLLALRVEQSINLYAGFKERYGAHKFGNDSKWFVPPNHWPADLKYPAYNRGYFVVHSMETIRKFNKASLTIEKKYRVTLDAHIDDVYAGLLAQDSGIEAQWLPHLYIGPPKLESCPVWSMIATLLNVVDDRVWDRYWELMINFDPIKYKCVDLRRIIYRNGL